VADGANSPSIDHNIMFYGITLHQSGHFNISGIEECFTAGGCRANASCDRENDDQSEIPWSNSPRFELPAQRTRCAPAERNATFRSACSNRVSKNLAIGQIPVGLIVVAFRVCLGARSILCEYQVGSLRSCSRRARCRKRCPVLSQVSCRSHYWWSRICDWKS
jgi:hypothetical protein